MTISIDFTDTEAYQGGGIVPEGQYLAQVVETKETRSAVKATPGIEVTFEIVGGPDAGRKLWDTLWLTQNAAGRVKWCLQSAGITVPNGPMNIDPFALQGKRVKLTVRHEQYEKDGETRTAAKVKSWDAPTSGFAPGTPGAPAAGAAAPSGSDIPF
jgi:hypothetical protein